MFEIKILRDPVGLHELAKVAKEGFGDMIKAVVDIKQEVLGIGGELHADIEVKMMDEVGSKREDTWGINLYPEKTGDDFIEFDSLVNIKPAFGNRSRDVESMEIQEKIQKIVYKFITR